MNDWLSTLHEFFIDRQPFVVATVVAYHGSSPDTPGAALIHSATKSVRFIQSDQRHSSLLKTAATILTRPVAFHTEQFALGTIAGSDNGFCEVIYEHFDARSYPEWLTRLRKNRQKGYPCTLLREFDNNHTVVRTEVLQRASTASLIVSNESNKQAECAVNQQENSLQLLRNVGASAIAITLVGNHPVAEEIYKQSQLLPIEMVRAEGTTEHAYKAEIVIIMTRDHELDYQHSETALRQLHAQNAFIGCIGSEKKADIFTARLLSNGITKNQLKHFYMPLGVKQISGKQNAVVAASIIAQILMHHRW